MYPTNNTLHTLHTRQTEYQRLPRISINVHQRNRTTLPTIIPPSRPTALTTKTSPCVSAPNAHISCGHPTSTTTSIKSTQWQAGSSIGYLVKWTLGTRHSFKRQCLKTYSRGQLPILRKTLHRLRILHSILLVPPPPNLQQVHARPIPSNLFVPGTQWLSHIARVRPSCDLPHMRRRLMKQHYPPLRVL